MGSKHLPRVEGPMETSGVLLGGPGVEHPTLLWGPKGLRNPWRPQMFSQEAMRWALNVIMGPKGLRNPWTPQILSWELQELRNNGHQTST